MADEDFHVRQARARQSEKKNKTATDIIQDNISRNKIDLEYLRRENKELRMALHTTLKESSKSVSKAESDILQSKIFFQRRSYDDLCASNKETLHQIKKLEETQRALLKENRMRAELCPHAQKIRELENRLDRTLVKHNEAVRISRTYETVLRSLQEESLGYDNQLLALEKALKAKEHDDIELRNIAHDAEHAKEMARSEMDELKKATEIERQQKRKELEERKAFVSARLDHVQKQEKLLKLKKNQEEEAAAATKLQNEENERKALASTYEEIQKTEEEARRHHECFELYRKIKDVSRSRDKYEIVAKWHELRDTTNSLRVEEEKVQARIDALLEKRTEIREKLNESKYSGSAQICSRRVLDEFITHLEIAKINLKKAMDDCDETRKLHVQVKSGVEHIAQKLSLYSPEMIPPPIEDGDSDNTVNVMKHCDEKLEMLIEELEARGIQVKDPDEIEVIGKELAAMSNVEMPDHNLRVHTVQLEDTEEKEQRSGRHDDDGDDDPHSREDLKKMTASAVESEMKKASKRKKH